LIGAITATRFQRMQESALLRTIGASAHQIRSILLTEYLALGTVAGAIGIMLALVAGWLLAVQFFEVSFRASVLWLALTWTGIVIGTTTIGIMNNKGVLSRTPLATLRELSD
ncbi:MAG: FtsX-like permease family protein, partial [Gemmatimonadales bacterium]